MKLPELTPREIQIIKLLCRQYTSEEIGEELGLSKRSIEDHRHRLIKKLGVKNVVGIVLYAIEQRIIDVRKVRKS